MASATSEVMVYVQLFIELTTVNIVNNELNNINISRG